MNALHDTNNEIILELITSLHPVPPRDFRRAEATRAQFLLAVNNLEKRGSRPSSPNGVPATHEPQRQKELIMFSKPQFTRYGFIAIILVITLFFGGVWATAAYAQVALPGDMLYSVKTGLEDAQVSFSADAAKDAHLHLQYADLRLKEMDRLVERGRFDDLGIATAKFEYHIQETIKALAAIAVNDPEQARVTAISVNESLAQSTAILTSLITSVPESAQPSLKHAILSSEAALDSSEIEFTGVVDSITPGSWVISGLTVLVDAFTEMDELIVVGDQVKVEGLINPDGTVQAEEIKLVDGDGINGNDAEDMNDNDGDDMNDNDDDAMNDNDDDIMNDNDDDAMNDNDDDIMNDNDDDIMNDNGDDDMNDNTGDDMNDNVGEDIDNSGGDDDNDNNTGPSGGGGDDNDNSGGGGDDDDNDNGGGDNDNG